MLIDDLLWLIIIYTFADLKNCKKNNLFNFYVAGAVLERLKFRTQKPKPI